jgi:hypothetical protein
LLAVIQITDLKGRRVSFNSESDVDLVLLLRSPPISTAVAKFGLTVDERGLVSILRSDADLDALVAYLRIMAMTPTLADIIRSRSLDAPS